MNIDTDNAELLKKSLDNELNMAIYDLTFEDVLIMKRNIIDEVIGNVKIQSSLIEKLRLYRYIDDLNDLRDGAYIRWLSVIPNARNMYALNKGAIFCNVVITQEGVNLVCRSVATGKFFRLARVDQYVFFQKMSYQELLILQAIDQIKHKRR